MIKAFFFLITMTLILTAGPEAYAQEYQRKVTVEWEAMEAAKSYDLEFIKVPSNPKDKPLIFKANGSEWTGTMTIGTYMMRLRARDRRNVPGDWSGAEEFKVNLETAKLVSPKSQEILKTDQTKEAEIILSWNQISGAAEYTVEISSEDGATKVNQTVTENKLSATLPIGKKYTWKVNGIGGAYQSDAVAVDEFTIWGKKLDKPTVQQPESEYVRELKWNTPEGATSFDYVIARLDSQNKKWEVIEKLEKTNVTKVAFKEEWIGGKYRFILQANGDMRPESEKEEIKFSVIDGNRSETTEYTQTLRQSIDRTTGLYGIASYLVTMIDYKGRSDTGANVKFSSVGGTGRVGLGYLNPKNSWGFIGIADYSGFFVDKKVYNFASVEMNGIYRTRTSQLGESRHQFGLFYKELPEIQGNGLGEYTGTGVASTLGPHYGYEFWKAVTPKIGFQANAHAYLNLAKVKTAGESQGLNPTLSYQLGLLGSYRFKRNLTGLVGYAYRYDSMSYKTLNPLTLETDKSFVNIQGHYLNLFLEWSL